MGFEIMNKSQATIFFSKAGSRFGQSFGFYTHARQRKRDRDGSKQVSVFFSAYDNFF